MVEAARIAAADAEEAVRDGAGMRLASQRGIDGQHQGGGPGLAQAFDPLGGGLRHAGGRGEVGGEFVGDEPLRTGPGQRKDAHETPLYGVEDHFNVAPVMAEGLSMPSACFTAACHWRMFRSFAKA